MSEPVLHAARLNHGQTSVRLGSGNARTVATNEVLFVARKHAAAADYEAFESALHRKTAETSLQGASASAIAAELRLSDAE